jgi:two-component system sensor histidine kinase TctE
MSSSAKPASSLQRQLLLWLLGPLVLLFLVNTVLGYRVAIATANEAYDRLLLASVKAIADRVTVVGGEITVDIPYVALELFESNIRERIFYKVSAPDGSTLTGYEDLPPPPAGASTTRATFFRSRYRDETLYQVALYKPLYDPALRGMVLIQVGETAESREALSRRILYDSLVPQGLLICFAALFLVIGVRSALRPLLRLRDSIAARGSTDLQPVHEDGVQGEVRPLIQALNLQASRIDLMLTARLNFVADAAHQIRTRLSILRTQVEYGLRLEDASAVRAVLSDALGIVREAGRFFNQLLVLAHAEAKAIPGLDREPVDIAALCHATAMEWVAAARAKQINLGFEGRESGLVVRGNAVLLAELVSNVLDNAVRYAHPGGTVTLRAREDVSSVVIEVEDDGPGIPQSERARVFDRFYRLPSTDGEGSGLGLAIAAEICRSHRASISLSTPAAGTGLLVAISFPDGGGDVLTSPGRSGATA